MIACEREVLLDVSRYCRRRRRRPVPKRAPVSTIIGDRSLPFSHRFHDRYAASEQRLAD
jgi:hypothetical protein